MPKWTTGSETSNNRGSDVDSMTAAEALRLLYAVATRDPYHGGVSQLVDARRVLESALGLEE